MFVSSNIFIYFFSGQFSFSGSKIRRIIQLFKCSLSSTAAAHNTQLGDASFNYLNMQYVTIN